MFSFYLNVPFLENFNDFSKYLIQKLLIKFFEGINEAILKVVFVVIWYSPIGIIFLIASVVLEDDFATVGVRNVFSSTSNFEKTV